MSEQPESPAAPDQTTGAGDPPAAEGAALTTEAVAPAAEGAAPTTEAVAPAAEGAAPTTEAVAPAATWTPPPSPPESGGAGIEATLQQRPELAVGGAFAGGFVLALILKRLAR